MSDQFDLRSHLVCWSGIAELHRAALGDGWDVAERFVALHTSAMWQFAATARPLGVCERAAIQMGVHSLNLYTGALGLLVRGQFDVASYLMRSVYDSHSLLQAASTDEDNARRLLGEIPGKRLSASHARVWVERNGGFSGYGLEVDEPYQKEIAQLRSAMNRYAHTGHYQAESVLSIAEGGITPTFGGHLDGRRLLRDVAIIGKLEMYTLTVIGRLHPSLDGEWFKSYSEAFGLYQMWFRESVKPAVAAGAGSPDGINDP